MSDRRTVNVVCAKAPRRIACVPAVSYQDTHRRYYEKPNPRAWYCSFCGARVKVVA